MLTNRASRPPLLLPSCRLFSNSTGKIMQYSVRLYDYVFFLRLFRKPIWDVKRVWVGPNAECHAVCLAILTHFHCLPLDKNAFDLKRHICVSLFPLRTRRSETLFFNRLQNLPVLRVDKMNSAAGGTRHRLVNLGVDRRNPTFRPVRGPAAGEQTKKIMPAPHGRMH
jgi:hypothetical protein